MFIKLTKLDGSPIWINAAFVVTVEPRKGGGAVVVPVGDGLDYDVRETPETVLAVLGDPPAPAILPIPTTDALTATPEDVSDESTEQLVTEVRQAGDAEAKPAEAIETDEEKPTKKSRKTAPKKPRATRKKKVALSLSEEQIERLKKMAPGSLKKLQNTLITQFKIEDAEGAVEALAANGVLNLDRDHVVWSDKGEKVS